MKSKNREKLILGMNHPINVGDTIRIAGKKGLYTIIGHFVDGLKIKSVQAKRKGAKL